MKKISIPKNERKKYKDSILNHTSYEKYTANLSNRRKNIVVSDLISFCHCFHSPIQDLLVSEEEANEKVDIFERFLFDNNYALATVESRVKTVRSFYRANGYDMPKKCDEIDKTYRDIILESESYNDFLSIKTLAENTQQRYLSDLTDYCHFNDMGIDELIAEADDEEVKQVRKNKRTIKTRLIDFRRYLREKGYSEKQIQTRFRNVKGFYRRLGFEIPFIPADTKQYDRQLRYDEIPTKEHIKRALEGTSNIRNKAIFLFMATSGCASAETRTFTVREWMLGTKDFHGETTDIQRALDKMDGEMEFIPAFPIVREKKHLDFYALITPEANQYIINWLKTRENLTLDDYVFDISEDGLIYAFASINDKFNWGKVKDGRHRFFSSHQMRRFHFNVFGIENRDFANAIEGRKFSATEESYWKRDPEKLKKQYRKEEFLNSLTIYQKYQVKDISSKEYDEMQQKLQEKDEEFRQLKTQKDNEINELKKELKEQAENFERNQRELKDRLVNVEKNVPNLYNTDPDHVNFATALNLDVEVAVDTLIQTYYEMDYRTPLADKIKTLNNDELIALKDITYGLAMDNENPTIDYVEVEPLIKKAFFLMENKPAIKEGIINYHDKERINQKKQEKYKRILYDKLNAMGFWDEDELEEYCDKISFNFILEVNNYSLEEITGDLVLEDILKYL